MNTGRRLLFVAFTVTLAGDLQAACIDRGTSAFADSADVVEICENEVCSLAEEFSSCGNVQYISQEFVLGSEIWLFRVRTGDPQIGIDREYAVERRPADPYEIPQTIVDGRPMRMVIGTPLEEAILRQVSCVPVRDPEGCDFIDEVLSGMN